MMQGDLVAFSSRPSNEHSFCHDGASDREPLSGQQLAQCFAAHTHLGSEGHGDRGTLLAVNLEVLAADIAAARRMDKGLFPASTVQEKSFCCCLGMKSVYAAPQLK